MGNRGLAEAADIQRGIIHRSQLISLGISRGSITHRVRTGALRPMFPSVWAVGHRALAPEALEIAALLYAGADAVLSHGTAGAVWGLVARPEEVHLTVAGRNVRHRLYAERRPALTRSEAERRMRALCERAGLPRPVVGARPCGFPVGFLWPQARLVLEVDGLAFPAHRRAFETDRRRDQILVAAGYRVVRVTWRQLTEEPLAVMVRIAQALVVSTDQRV